MAAVPFNTSFIVRAAHATKLLLLCAGLLRQSKLNLFPRCFKHRKPVQIHLQNFDRLPF